MSEKLCTLRGAGGGGGRYTETSLWTNSAPTSSFSGQDITLSQGMSDFKYLKIKCAVSTSSSSGVFEDIILVSELSNTSSATTNNTRDRLVLGLGRDTYDYERAYYCISDTSIHFNPCYQSGTSTTTAAKIIPLEILGLNELDHGKRFDETVLWTNNAPTSAFGQQTVTLSDDFSNYDYIKINFRNNVSDATASEALISASALAQTNDIFPNLTIRGRYSNTPYVRQVYRASTTQITIVTAYQMAGTGANNNAAIPTSIVGCKFR